jgi:CheY-like chemotaxis protein
MKQLVEDTLDVSRAAAAGLELSLHPQEVEALVSDAVDAVWSTARAKDVHIDARAASGLRLRCDPTRMFQALVNLLDNAVRYTPTGGRVVVEARPERGDVLFSVSDPGPGIPESDLPHVFDRFWQGRNQRRAGAGLGLTIVKGIVDAHGGRIWVESEEGRGTCFRIAVPMGGPAGTDPRHDAAGLTDRPPAERQPGGPTSVFLADDDDGFREALRRALAARGYEVREASDGATALGFLASSAAGDQPVPDVVVLDVRMPGCSGLGVMNAMNKLPAMPPTLLVTGFRDPSIQVLADRLGVHRVLFKPIEVDRVVEAVQEAARAARGQHPGSG